MARTCIAKDPCLNTLSGRFLSFPSRDWLLGPWRGHAETEDDNDYLEKWNNLIFSPEEATSESEQVDKSENIGVSKLDKMSASHVGNGFLLIGMLRRLMI